MPCHFELVYPYDYFKGSTVRFLIPALPVATGAIIETALPVWLFNKHRKGAYDAILLRISNVSGWGSWRELFLSAVIDAGR